jgi:hypothetical protein
MKGSDSLQALRRANPRAGDGFAESVQATAETVRAQVLASADEALDAGAASPRTGRSRPRRRLAGLSAAGLALAVAAAVAATLTVGSPVGTGVASAAAAVRKAATVTAASAERSGTAAVRITHDGKLWAASTIRWHGRDLAVTQGYPRRPNRAGSRLLVVDGTMYGVDHGGWVQLGSPDSVDPGSGTTPGEYLAAVREDVGGATLRRITGAMRDLTTRRLGDGATVYSGHVAAGLIARETGFKEGRAIRVLPFGYVAHDEAADPAAVLRAEVTVDAQGVIRQLTVGWGGGASSWTYQVDYARLGSTPAPVAPANARPLREQLRHGG